MVQYNIQLYTEEINHLTIDPPDTRIFRGLTIAFCSAFVFIGFPSWGLERREVLVTILREGVEL